MKRIILILTFCFLIPYSVFGDCVKISDADDCPSDGCGCWNNNGIICTNPTTTPPASFCSSILPSIPADCIYYTGSGGNSNNCPWAIKCPSGKKLSSSYSCESCGAGYYNAEMIYSSIPQSCVSCIVDHYCPEVSGATTQQSCPTSYSSNSGSTQCSDCTKTCSATDFPSTLNGDFLIGSSPTGSLSAMLNSNVCSVATNVSVCVFEYQCNAGYTGEADTATTNPNCVSCAPPQSGTDNYQNKFCPQGTVPNNVQNCPSGVSGSDGARVANTDCYKNYSVPSLVGCGDGATVSPNSPQKKYYNTASSSYPAPNWTITAGAGYVVNNNGTPNPSCTQCGAGNYISNGICTTCPDGKYCEGDGVANNCKNGFNHSGTNPNEDNIAHNTATDCYVSASKACGTNGCFTLPGNANTLRYWTNRGSARGLRGSPAMTVEGEDEIHFLERFSPKMQKK